MHALGGASGIYAVIRLLQRGIPMQQRVTAPAVENKKDTRQVLVRDDGAAVAFGRRDDGRCNVPPLPDGVRYVPREAALRMRNRYMCNQICQKRPKGF